MRISVQAALVLAVMGLSTPSHATVEIEGAASTLQVRASGDAISDVLTAISTVASVRYLTEIPRGVTITGTYSGSAEAVIARLLSGYSFAMRRTGELLEVSIYGRWVGNPSTQNPPSLPNSAPTLPATPAASEPDPALSHPSARYPSIPQGLPYAATRHRGG